MKNLQYFLQNKEIQKAAIFMSGSGTNAIKVLDYWKIIESPKWKPVVIITDAPDESKAKEIAEKYKLPLVSHDIRVFYRSRGLHRISIKSNEGQKVREEWTNELRKIVSKYDIDFGVLAGFVPLTNITNDFPCLNIHPGDLTVEKNGRRLLVGLHTIPIEAAIIDGFNSLRSSVILAQSYTGAGGEMDSGPILGISPAVPIDFKSYSREYLIKIFKRRPQKKPRTGYKDELEKLAKDNQESLKCNGDWIVFPRVVNDFAENKFAFDCNQNQLFYNNKGGLEAVKTIIYGENIKEMI